jgi:hypothetical protein
MPTGILAVDYLVVITLLAPLIVPGLGVPFALAAPAWAAAYAESGMAFLLAVEITTDLALGGSLALIFLLPGSTRGMRWYGALLAIQTAACSVFLLPWIGGIWAEALRIWPPADPLHIPAGIFTALASSCLCLLAAWRIRVQIVTKLCPYLSRESIWCRR